MILIKNEWEVKEIEANPAKTFVEHYHYAHGAGKMAHKYFGLYYKGDPNTLHGVAIWNPPPLGAAKSVDPNHNQVLALTRFCLTDSRPENSGSFLISKSIKLLNNRWQMLLTYADTALDHNGGLYRAANWDYDGMTGKNPIFWDPVTNCMVSRKIGPKTYGMQAMLDKGYEFRGRYAKHRFVYPVNRRKRVFKPIGQQNLLFTKDGKIYKP